MKIKLIVSICYLFLYCHLEAQVPIVRAGFNNSKLIISDSIITLVRIGTPVSFTHIQDGIIVKTGLPIFFQVSDTISIQGLLPLDGIELFPNPFIDKLAMKRKGIPGNLTIGIYNNSGQSLYHMVWEEETEILTPGFTGYPHGAYFITVTNEGNTKGIQFKVIKN